MVYAFTATFTAVRADTIVLRNGSMVPNATITLGDIADLDGTAAVALADVKLGSFDTAGSRTFTLNEIRSTLSTRHINWGKIDLQGPIRLTVHRRTLDKPIATDTSAAANPIATLDAKSPTLGRTLRQLITDRIQRRIGRTDDSLRITCQQPDASAWSMSDARYRFEITPAARQTLGRIPFNIRCYKQDQFDSVQHLTVDVALRRQVVVTIRQLHRGQILTPDDLTSQSQWLDSDRVQPVTNLLRAVGQSTTRLLRSGAILQTNDIAPRLLVERGQLVTIRAVSGDIVVKFTARATENGAAGQIIEVRNPRSRETYTVRVVGPQETEMRISPQTNPPDKDKHFLPTSFPA